MRIDRVFARAGLTAFRVAFALPSGSSAQVAPPPQRVHPAPGQASHVELPLVAVP